MKTRLSFCLVLALAASMTSTAVTPNIERGKAAEAARWADSVYNTLTERQRIAQLVFPKVNPAQGETSKATIKRLVATDGCGGLLFTGGMLKEYATMIDYAQIVAKVPVMMTLDGEWGPAMRLKDAPLFPHNMTLGAITDMKLLYRYGQEVARECRLMGIDVNFAPDADVNSNPANPVIGDRSFGDNPRRVALASVAYSLGLEDGGVQAVAKHFPGHGDTDSDSHKTLPTVNHSVALLDSTDLVPFKEYIGAGCSGIMVGHLSVPALDPSGRPASLSHTITSDFLKQKLGFEGLVYTDALGMKGADLAGENGSVAALLAGADVLLCPLSPKNDINAVEAAVKSGKISRQLIEERVKKLLRYKYILSAGKVCGDPAAMYKAVNAPQVHALIDELAGAAVTVLWNNDNVLPLGNGEKIALVSLGGDAGNDFAETCRHYAAIEALHCGAGETIATSALHKIAGADVVVAVVYQDNATARANYAKIAAKAKQLVGVFFTSPYRLSKYLPSIKKSTAVVLGYENMPPLRTAGAASLFGGNRVSGQLPVTVPGVAASGAGIHLAKTRLGFASPAAVGMAAWLGDSINAIVNEGLKTGAFPGCQVLVAKDGEIVFDRAFGRLTAKESSKVTRQTIYDLASVSKAVGTLPGIMKVYDGRRGLLDERLATLIPEIADSAKREIDVRSLLYHETGMPASLNMFDAMIDSTSYTGKLITRRRDAAHPIKIYKNVYGNGSARLRSDVLRHKAGPGFSTDIARGLYGGRATYDTIMSKIYNIPLRSNRNYNYSCLNFCLLMDIEQRITGRQHAEFVGTEIFAPLGMYRTGYRPLEWTDVSTVAPTEYDSFLRKQTVRGYVHDELAAFSGGVQGNAGLFANAGDVAKYCQMLLNGGVYGGKRVLSEETVKLFTTDKSPTCRRGLGFDKPDKENDDWSPTCSEANGEVFGHLGFTGTVFWVDPTQNLIFVFLTNRVNPTRDNAAFNRINIRPHLFSVIYQSLQPAAD